MDVRQLVFIKTWKRPWKGLNRSLCRTVSYFVLTSSFVGTNLSSNSACSGGSSTKSHWSISDPIASVECWMRRRAITDWQENEALVKPIGDTTVSKHRFCHENLWTSEAIKSFYFIEEPIHVSLVGTLMSIVDVLVSIAIGFLKTRVIANSRSVMKVTAYW